MSFLCSDTLSTQLYFSFAGEISQPRTLKIVFKLKREQPQTGNFGLKQGLSLPYLDRAIAITATRLNTH